MTFLVNFPEKGFELNAAVVTGLTWALPGGSEKAHISLTCQSGVDWESCLFSAVSVRSLVGLPLWNGYIETITVPDGEFTQFISGRGLVNRVKVRYKRPGFFNPSGEPLLETDWIDQLESQVLYGIHERCLTIGLASEQAALALAGKVLAQQAFPRVRLQAGKQTQQVSITARGWYESLHWRVDAEAAGRVVHTGGGKSSLALGEDQTRQKLAQSIEIPPTGFRLGTFTVSASLVGNPTDDLRAAIYADAGGQPGEELAAVNKPASLLNGSWVELSFNLPAVLVLEGGSTIWLVLSRTGTADAGHFYRLQTDDGPGYGTCQRWTGSTWQNEAACLRFGVYETAPLAELIPALTGLLTRLDLALGMETPRWREGDRSQKERLESWLDLAAQTGLPCSAVVNHQRDLIVFPLPLRPDEALLYADLLQGPPPLGRVLDYGGKNLVIKRVNWNPIHGLRMST